MSVTSARKIEGYSDISEAVLSQTSIIRAISSKEITGTPGTTTVKVYANELATVSDYIPGTGIALSADGSNYVTINNLKERGINEILDGYTVETAPADLIVQRLTAGLEATGEDDDITGLAQMEVDGTIVINTAGAKPTVATIYNDILDLKLALDNAKAKPTKRYLTITPEMQNLLLHTDSKVILNTSNGDNIQTNGYIGTFLGFTIFMNVLLPAGVNMIANQERGFIFADEILVSAKIQSLDASGQFIGDSAVQSRYATVSGAVRPTQIQINRGQA